MGAEAPGSVNDSDRRQREEQARAAAGHRALLKQQHEETRQALQRDVERLGEEAARLKLEGDKARKVIVP